MKDYRLIVILSTLSILLAGCYQEDGFVITSLEMDDEIKAGEKIRIELETKDNNFEYSWVAERGEIIGSGQKVKYYAPQDAGKDKITLKISNSDGKEQIFKEELSIIENSKKDSYLTVNLPEKIKVEEEVFFAGEISEDIAEIKLNVNQELKESIEAVGEDYELSYIFKEANEDKKIEFSAYNQAEELVYELKDYITPKENFSYKQESFDLLARAVMGEAEGEIYKGKVAVAAVVLNRVESEEFPDTIPDVLYQENQFTIVETGRIDLAPNQDSISAAKDALAGKDPSQGALFFYNPETARNMQFFNRLKKIIKIDNHVFANAN